MLFHVLRALELTVPELFLFVTGAALVLSVLVQSGLVRGNLHAFLLDLGSLLHFLFLLLGLFRVKKDSDQLQLLVTVSYERRVDLRSSNRSDLSSGLVSSYGI